MDNSINFDIENVDFIEFCAKKVTDISPLLESMGFVNTFCNDDNSICLYQQNDITLIVNAKPNTPAYYYFKKHGPSICSLGIRVKSDNLVSQAKACGQKLNDSGFSILYSYPGIGGTEFYLTSKDTLPTIQNDLIKIADKASGHLHKIDHVAFNLYQGRSFYWQERLSSLFLMSNVMDFSISGKLTSFNSRGLINTDKSLRLVLSESQDPLSQISEYLRVHRGEGIQHIAFTSNNISESVSCLKKSGIEFVKIPQSYYDDISQRVKNHNEDIGELIENHILIDNDKVVENQILLQTFTRNLLGPLFFEVIQRKGNEGFGEGNITALFEAVEREQILNGSLQSITESIETKR